MLAQLAVLLGRTRLCALAHLEASVKAETQLTSIITKGLGYLCLPVWNRLVGLSWLAPGSTWEVCSIGSDLLHAMDLYRWLMACPQSCF